jgi:flavin reductase (DIM6/NTAB) family NADH-FMN oxidoreductase RutF
MIMIVSSEPAILYLGTPVVLLSAENADGSANLAPISSVFWLGWRAVLGISAASQTARNLLARPELVINLPSAAMAAQVDALALTTGANPVPEYKAQRGYTHVADKFAAAGLSPLASEVVTPPRVAQAPVQLEARIEAVHSLAADDPVQAGKLLTLEARILRVHVEDTILVPGQPNRIDPDRWEPLIMSFQKFYGLSGQRHPSRLSSIDEALYRSPDVDRARAA